MWLPFSAQKIRLVRKNIRFLTLRIAFLIRAKMSYPGSPINLVDFFHCGLRFLLCIILLQFDSTSILLQSYCGIFLPRPRDFSLPLTSPVHMFVEVVSFRDHHRCHPFSEIFQKLRKNLVICRLLVAFRLPEM